MRTKDELQADISYHLDMIAGMFKPGVKLTLVIRGIPGNNETDVVIGDDALSEAIAAIQRRQDALDVCEHDVKTGEWCHKCNLEYRAARTYEENR